MMDLTVTEAAAEFGVTRTAIKHWAKVGCPALAGQRLRLIKQKRRYSHILGEQERAIWVVPGQVVARIKQGLAQIAIPPDLVSERDAIKRFPWLTEERLYNWRQARPNHQCTKKTGARTLIAQRRGSFCPLGRPLTVERHPAATGRGIRLCAHYKIEELEEIGELLISDVGRIVEDGVEYKTARRIQNDYRIHKNLLSQVLRCLPPSERPTPITRNVFYRTSHGLMFRKRLKLWPDAKVREALAVHTQPSAVEIEHNGSTYVTIKEAARRSGFSDSRIRAWFSQPCRLIGRKLNPIRRHVANEGFRHKRAGLYVLLSDVEAVAANRQAALKAGWRLYGPLPPTIARGPAAADAVASQHVASDGERVRANHTQAMSRLRTPVFVSANEDRDRWIYDQRMLLTPWKAILFDLSRLAPTRMWESLQTDAACRLALKRLLERHPELPLPPVGKRGRPCS